MRRAYLFGGYLVISAVCLTLAFLLSRPGPADAADGFSHLISGIGLSLAASIFYKDGVAIYQSRRAARRGGSGQPPG